MEKIKVEKVEEYLWKIDKTEKMNVPVNIFASEKILEKIKQDKTLEQAMNMAKMSGVVEKVVVLPDSHQGYGACIGGVSAYDSAKGTISPGQVGYDINCGVRVLASNLSKEKFLEKRKKVLDEIYKNVPSGVGNGGEFKFNDSEMNEILEQGVKWLVAKGYGNRRDIEFCEDNGCINGADSSKISQKAKGRGRNQLGTIGAGNHFIDVHTVSGIYDKESAKAFGIKKKGQVCVMIHTGSRGLGHQTASDYIRKMEEEYGFKHLPDRELICAPINSELGKEYISAMNAAANFAFANRHLIMCQIRKSFEKHFSKVKLELVYDIAHNIAKFENYEVSGVKKKLCVHRKGATRSFGKGRKEIPEKYRKVGCPIFIPGSMGTSSYVLAGTKKAEKISFSSTAHGAGRVMSRKQAKEEIFPRNVLKKLGEKDIVLKTGNRNFCDEAPEVYKNVDEVVRVSDKLGIGKLVAELKPLGVVIG